MKNIHNEYIVNTMYTGVDEKTQQKVNESSARFVAELSRYFDDEGGDNFMSLIESIENFRTTIKKAVQN